MCKDLNVTCRKDTKDIEKVFKHVQEGLKKDGKDFQKSIPLFDGSFISPIKTQKSASLENDVTFSPIQIESSNKMINIDDIVDNGLSVATVGKDKVLVGVTETGER